MTKEFMLGTKTSRHWNNDEIIGLTPAIADEALYAVSTGGSGPF
jgi:hypothetical protein